jgi:hypothetical protein
MLKVELHAHTADDPVDRHSPYSCPTDRPCGRTGLRCAGDYAARASARRGAAGTVRGRTRTDADSRCRADDRGSSRPALELPPRRRRRPTRSTISRGLRQREAGLVVAPHPFFSAGKLSRGCMDRHAALFDAAEVNAMFTNVVDFNRPRGGGPIRYGKPLVGNGDIHRLRQLGTTYSLVDAEPDPEPSARRLRPAASASRAGRCRGSILRVSSAAWCWATSRAGGRPRAADGNDCYRCSLTSAIRRSVWASGSPAKNLSMTR